MPTAKTERLKTWSIPGTVLCTLMLGFFGLLAFVSINWHRPDGMSGWMFVAFFCGLVFRILRVNFFRWLLVVLCDLIIVVRIFDELVFPGLDGMHPDAASRALWLAAGGSLLLISDWTLRLILWRRGRGQTNRETQPL